MDKVIEAFKAFIEEAKELNAAFATVGEDDNSYDALELCQEAEDYLAHLTQGVVTSEDASSWLATAKSRLDNIA